MKFISRLRPLSWFLLVWVPFLALTGGYAAAANSGYPFVFMVLLVLHLGLYAVKFTITLNNRAAWLLFPMQAGLVLALTYLSKSMGLYLGLFLALVTAIMEIFKGWRSMTAGLVGALALYLLYTNSPLVIGFRWNMPWPAAVYSLFFVSGICFSFFLQQRNTLLHTQSLLSELEISHTRLSEYVLHIEELTALNERQHIARNLHDTLIQSVAGLLMQLKVVQSQLQHQRFTRAQELLEESLGLTRDVLADARLTLSDLRNEQIRSEDLVEIVQEEIARFTVRTKIPCDASLEALASIPGNNCHHVLRIISEALANITQHAHAHRAWVLATEKQEELIVEIGDDGIGFDPDGLPAQAGHYGLLGIRERARIMGGALDIVSVQREGTVLHLRIPPMTEAQS